MEATQQTLLKRHLSDVYVGKLPPLIQPSTVAANNEQKNTARALSAFFLHHHCGVPIDEACAKVVDDFGDLGVDAIYYDEDNSTLYLLQSKLKASEQFSQDEANAFCQGVRKLIVSDYNGFNQNVLIRRVEIDAALDDCERIQLVVVHTGDQLRQFPAQAIADLIADPAHGEDRFVDPRLPVMAKRNAASLQKVGQYPYAMNFTRALPSLALLNAVLAFRYIATRMIQEAAGARSEQERLTYRHGAYSVAFVMMKRLRKQIDGQLALNPQRLAVAVGPELDNLRQILWARTEPVCTGRNPLNVFKTQSDVSVIIRLMMTDHYNLQEDAALPPLIALNTGDEPYPQRLFAYLSTRAPQIGDLT